MSKFTEQEVNGFNPGINSNTPAGNSGIAEDNLQQEFNQHTNVYHCDNCGAEIITDENTAATFCYYCHSPVALKGRLDGKYRPSKIIPFKGTKEQAIEAYKLWSKKKKFLPKSWFSESQLEKITGLYVPYWLADVKVRAFFQGEGKIVTSHTSGNTTVTTTKIYNVVRDAGMQYYNMPADGSKKLDDALMDAIEPYNYKEILDFNSAYLSGFYADKYDVNKDEVLPHIYQRINAGAQQVLSDSARQYSSVRKTTANTTITNLDWEYALLPVWFMTYDYKNKKYFFAMNGQTGKIAGILPFSVSKGLLLASCISALCAIIGILMALYGG